MSPQDKIRTLDRLVQLRQEARQAGKTVVQCHGCFDIVHPGHIAHLQFARTLGDILVVSVSDDTHVNKGPDRPLIPADLRAGSVAALQCVDWVCVNPDPTAVGLLEVLKPDVYVKGREYENNCDPRFLAERDTVMRNGGRVIFSSSDVVYSSTALIGSIGREVFNDEKITRLRQQYGLTSHHLHDLMERAQGTRVVVVGDYLLDRYHFCETTGIASEGPMMSLRVLERSDYDGGAGVIALHLAGLGAAPTLVCGFADDDESRKADLRLRSAGIDVQSPRVARSTIVKHRYLAEQSKLMKVDEGLPTPADSRNEDMIAARVLAAAQGASAVIFADFGYGLITAGLLERILPVLRPRVPILAADVSGRRSNLVRFRGVDLLCPTEREVREVQHDFTGGLGAVMWNLLDQSQARQAIVTLGKQGLVTFQRHERSPATSPDPTATGRLHSEYLPALSDRAIDPLGCGDALLATASLTLAAGGSLQAAALLGSIAAAIEAEQIGNIPVTGQQIARRVFRTSDRPDEASNSLIAAA